MRWSVETTGREGKREREVSVFGSYRVVSTASIGKVKRSSSQPYALGVNLITVCLREFGWGSVQCLQLRERGGEFYRGILI